MDNRIVPQTFGKYLATTGNATDFIIGTGSGNAVLMQYYLSSKEIGFDRIKVSVHHILSYKRNRGVASIQSRRIEKDTKDRSCMLNTVLINKGNRYLAFFIINVEKHQMRAIGTRNKNKS